MKQTDGSSNQLPISSLQTFPYRVDQTNHRGAPPPPPPPPALLLTSHDELALVLHGGGLVAGDAGVVAVVVGRQVVDAQRAGEVDVVHRHAQAGRDRPAVLLPRDVQRPVARHDHAGDEDALADGEALELEGLDVGRHCGGENREVRGQNR